MSLCAALALAVGLAACGGGEDPRPGNVRQAGQDERAAPSAPAPPPPGRRVRFRAADGVRLTGTFRPAGRGAPVVVCVHQLNGSPAQFDPIAADLHAAGLATLAYRSRDPGLVDAARLAPDVAGAARAAARLGGVPVRRVGLLGSSAGADAVTFALGTGRAGGARVGVGLSPAEGPAILDAAAKGRFRPRGLLLIADEREATDIDFLLDDAGGSGIDKQVSPHGGHGVLQLEHADVRRAIVERFRTRLDASRR